MNKMIAPVFFALITAIAISVFGMLYIWAAGMIPGGLIVQIIISVIAASLVTTLTVVLIQRIKEIKRGEDDDLGKY